MPTKAEQLNPNSTDQEAQTAISDCISMMSSEHPEWKNEQAIAACHSMAEKAMGRPAGRKSISVRGTSPAAPKQMMQSPPGMMP